MASVIRLSSGAVENIVIKKYREYLEKRCDLEKRIKRESSAKVCWQIRGFYLRF